MTMKVILQMPRDQEIVPHLWPFPSYPLQELLVVDQFLDAGAVTSSE